jgi:hypothetical protein
LRTGGGSVERVMMVKMMNDKGDNAESEKDENTKNNS